MDPAIANQNLDPPRERVVTRGLLPALVVNVLVIGALAFGVNWKFGGDRTELPSDARRTSTADANDTARMGGAPTPPAEAPVTPWPTAAATGTVAATPPIEQKTQVASVSLPVRAAEPPAKPAKPEPPPAKAAVQPAPAKPVVQAARLEPPRAKPAETARAQPSFDCAKARSPTERLICRDPELAKLDRELGRVHAQAKRAAADPLDFKRENDDEWSLREAVCRDKDCLLEWYAHRRQQLQERIAQSR